MIVFKGIDNIEIDMANNHRYYLRFGDDKDEKGLHDFIEMRKSARKIDQDELDIIINSILLMHNAGKEQKKEQRIIELDERINELDMQIRVIQEEKAGLSEAQK